MKYRKKHKRRTYKKGGSKKQKRNLSKTKRNLHKLSELINPEIYHNYLHLGKIESPQLVDSDFSIQNNPQFIEISKKLLFDIVNESTYSLLPYYFMKNMRLSDQDDIVSQYNSGNCVFFAKKVLQNLAKNGIRGYLIPATTLKHLMQPGFPEFCHCVVLVRLIDQYVIYEPAFYILEPILVNMDGTPSKYLIDVYGDYWTYTYDSKTNRINVTNDSGELQLYYSLIEIQNPSTAISYPVNIHNKRLPIVKYDPVMRSKKAHLSIRLDTKCLEGYCYDKSSDNNINDENNGWFPRFPYESILQSAISDEEKKSEISSWEGLSHKQCEYLQCDRQTLLDKLFLIMNYHNK